MKPAAAIIEGISAQSLALVKAKVRALTDAEQHEAKALERHATAREITSRARLELGQALAVERERHPVSGPGAKRWTEFLLAAGIGADKAKDAIRYSEVVAERFRGALDADAPRDERTRLPSMAEAGIDLRPRGAGVREEDDDQTGAKAPCPAAGSPPPPFRELTADEIIAQRAELNRAAARLPAKDRKRVAAADKVANLQGNSGEVERGQWCTPKAWAHALGTFDVDLFSNPRSHIAAVDRCMLEDGGDGFGGVEPGTHPGLYIVGARHGVPARSGVAGKETRTFFQWPYTRGFAERALAHHGHTRFTALLRLSTDPAWFSRLWPLVAVLALPIERLEFEPPPGIDVPESTISYPHAIYYACADDVTRAIRDRCIVLPVDHGRCDPAILRTALRLVE